MKPLQLRETFIIVVIVLLAGLPAIANPYIANVANLLIIYMILTSGLNLLMGYAGQFALANAAIFGLGAYATSILRIDIGLPFYLAAPLGILCAASIGVCLAFPALRLSGVHLALATMSFAWATQWAFLHWESVTRGSGGIPLPQVRFGIAGLDDEKGVYYLSLMALVLVLFGIKHVIGSRFGRAFVAMRDGEIAAQSLGIDLVAYKALAFALSSVCAGIAGALHTATLNYVAPDSFTLFQMIVQMAMVVAGGIGSLLGPVLGACILLVALELLRDAPGLQEALFGAFLLGFVLFQPGGLIRPLERWFPGLRQPLHGGHS